MRRQHVAHAEGADKLRHPHRAKNVNSIRSVSARSATRRQADGLEDGWTIKQETGMARRHGADSPAARSSDADDYRYFPEPDMLPLTPAEAVEELRASCQNSPERRRRRTSGASPRLEFQDIANGGLLTRSSRRSPPGQRRHRTQVVDGRAEPSRERPARRRCTTTRERTLMWPSLTKLIDDGTLTDSSHARSWAGVIDGEGSPQRSCREARSRGGLERRRSADRGG